MKCDRRYFILGLLSLIFLMALIFFISKFLKNQESSRVVCFREKCVNVEIADDHNERRQGLMFRSNLEKNSGMLFIFESSEKYDFWMKNTLIPLEIIWINEDYKIVDIQKAVPCTDKVCQSYTPKGEARYVLEVNYGFTAENGIEIGDEVNFFL